MHHLYVFEFQQSTPKVFITRQFLGVASTKATTDFVLLSSYGMEPALRAS